MPGALMPENRDGRQPILGKVMICVTEDWFALSHFRPLIRRLCQIAADVVVVTRSSGRLAEIEQMGARTIHLEYNRSSMNPVREMRTTRQLAALMRRERPDAVHLIAMKPIVLGGLAVLTGPVRHTVVHMTGLGFLAISDTAKARLARKMALAIIRRVIAQPESWLLVENPEDLTFLEQGGAYAEKAVVRANTLMQLPEGTRFQVLAPVVRGRKGEYLELIADLSKQGFARAKIDGQVGISIHHKK